LQTSCPAGGERGLTAGEILLTRSVFGTAIDCSRVRIRRRRWFPWQPHSTVMAPCGHLHLHPGSNLYRDDFACASIEMQALFVHEMTHVWQAQTRGWWYLPLVWPFSHRYDYTLRSGWPLTRYGIEQQAEIVSHGWLLRQGLCPPGGDGNAVEYERLIAFPGTRRPPETQI